VQSPHTQNGRPDQPWVTNNNVMSSPNVKSPDSAISSLNNLSLTGSARNSPRKPTTGHIDRNAATNNNVMSQKNNMTENDFCRTRTPAFGQSERWTEL